MTCISQHAQMAAAEGFRLQRAVPLVDPFQQLPVLVANRDDEPTVEIELMNELERYLCRRRSNHDSLIGGGPWPSRLRRRENDVHVPTTERVKVSAALLRTLLLGDDRIDFGGQVAEHRRRVGCRGAKLQDTLCANELERFDHGHDGQVLRRFPKLALVFGLFRAEQRAGELDERVTKTTFGGISGAVGNRARGLNGAHVTRNEQRPYPGVGDAQRGNWPHRATRRAKLTSVAAENA